MKKIAYYLVLIGVLSGIGVDQTKASVLSKECDEGVKEAKAVIKRNFDINGWYLTNSNDDPSLISESLEKAIEFFPYNFKLKKLYGQFLFAQDQTVEGLTEFAQYICFDDGVLISDTKLFLGGLSRLTIGEKSVGTILEAVIDQFNRAVTFGMVKSERTPSKEFIFENLTDLLNVLERLPTIDCYNATLMIMVDHMKRTLPGEMISEYISKLYTNNEAKASPCLKLIYANDYLIPRKRYSKAISLLTEVMGLDKDEDVCNPYQIRRHYVMMGKLFLISSGVKGMHKEGQPSIVYPGDAHERLKHAKNYLKWDESYLSNEIDILHHLAMVHFYLQEFDAAITILRKLLDSDISKIDGYDEKHKKSWKTNLGLALQLSGREEEYSAMLLEQQQKVLQRNKKVVGLIRAMQEQSRKEEPAEKEKTKQPARVIHPFQSSINTFEETGFGEPSKQDAKQDQPPPKKEKKKTKGIAHPPSTSGPILPLTPPQLPLLHIEDLTTNKHAHKTFYALFGKYDSNVKSDSNVKISMDNITCLFKAIKDSNKQVLDPSKGKGSHTKGTLNLSEQGSPLRNQIILLSKEVHLKPEQIKDVRLAFIQARLVPKDPVLIDRLKAEKLLD